MSDTNPLSLIRLREAYRTGRETPRRVIEGLLDAAPADPHRVWITRLTPDRVMAYVEALEARSEFLPLRGVPFVIKDNIDLAGVATTAGCPDFAYVPSESAPVVQRLIDAGAVPLGKTNLDQFATGLVGTRSPYGACRNSINPEYISGGSSSGSAVAVALGLASFSLGTDTAGSGRVPAAFNNLVGLKPSLGRLSTRGVVPACRSLDCVSIFAASAAEAACVLDSAGGFDAADPYSRIITDRGLGDLRFGVPRADQLRFFGDCEYERLYGSALRRLQERGGNRVEIDFEPFLETARLLYDGPWIAERFAAVGAFLDARPEALHPVTRRIIDAGRQPSAAAAFAGLYRLQALQRKTSAVWSQVDLIVTPTAGTIYRLEEVFAEPLRLNANLGYYTNFMNLLDLCGVAVPAGFRSDGLPFGITLVGPRGTDHALLELAGRLEPAPAGAAGQPLFAAAAGPPGLRTGVRPGCVPLAVCGAHMQGLPLNHQLRERGAYLLEATTTAACYRLIALPGGPPPRPGLVRVEGPGERIEVEVWALPAEQLGSLIAGIPAPLAVGRVELTDGNEVNGFVCEGYAAAGGTDISRFGGWRRFLREGPG